MAEPTSNWWQRISKNGLAFLASLTFHVGLLLVLACIAYQAGARSDGLLINASTGQSDTTAFDEVQTFELTPDDAFEESTVIDAAPEIGLDLDIQSTFTDIGNSGGDSLTLTSVNVDSLSKKNTKAPTTGAKFFGAYAKGNRFVYIVDSSRSMEGDRWKYARSQLFNSLVSLSPEQEFFIICFDVETSFLFTKDPERVRFYNNDDKTIQRVRNWMRGQLLGRSTMPRRALQYALSYRPDAIFLLSDGELRDDSRFYLRQINSNVGSVPQVPIHTIHLFSEEGRETLRMIAEENGGSFTPVEHRRLSIRER